MLEFPEVHSRAAELESALKGKRVTAVLPPVKLHKFCWFTGDPSGYESLLKGSTIESAVGFGIFVEIRFDNGKYLVFNDGVNIRFMDSHKKIKTYQLLISFEDGTALSFSVAMYGGIYLHDGDFEEEYYLKSLHGVSPLSEEFKDYFNQTISGCKQTLSAKAFLATEQRFPGIGNGVLQDILFEARIPPKRKLNSLSESDRKRLLKSVVSVLQKMLQNGGRDTENNLYGERCGYQTKMSKNTVSNGCPECGGEIVKETYLGGSVYYCPKCQPL